MTDEARLARDDDHGTGIGSAPGDGAGARGEADADRAGARGEADADRAGARGEADRARLEATVHGRVQGVGFRYFVRSVADDLGIGGWVANAQDGTVVCVAEGPRWALHDLARAVEAGPPGSRVDRVDLRWTIPTGTDGRFIIRSLGHGGD